MLETEGIDIGVVEGVCGMINYEFTAITAGGNMLHAVAFYWQSPS